MLSNAIKAMNFGYVEIRSALHDFAAGGLQNAENTVGGWRTSFKYKAVGIWNSYRSTCRPIEFSA